MRISGKEERLLDLTARLSMQERREALAGEARFGGVSGGRRGTAGTTDPLP